MTRPILLVVGKTDLDFAQKLYQRISHQENGVCRSTNYQFPGSSSTQHTCWRRSAVIRDLWLGSGRRSLTSRHHCAFV